MTIVRSEWTGRFNRIVEAGGFVFLSGVVARDAAADVAGQTADILSQIEELLGKAGLTKASIVSANIWLANIADISLMNAAWDLWVEPTSAPVRATVESKLARPDLLVEIQVQAFRSL